MESRIDGRRARYAAFLLLAATINVADSAITRSIADPGKRVLRPLDAEGPPGILKRVARIALAVDDDPEFRRALSTDSFSPPE